MFACFLFPTTVCFETIAQIQPYAMEENKLKDTEFQQVPWKQAAREWRDFYLEGMAEVGVQLLLANLWSSQCKSWKKKSLTKVSTFLN